MISLHFKKFLEFNSTQLELCVTQFYLSLEVFLECIFLVYAFVNGLITQMLAFCNLLCYFTLGYKRRVSIKKCYICPRSAIMC